jgi:hypothetical protein
MKYIGNISNFINDEIIEYVKTNTLNQKQDSYYYELQQEYDFFKNKSFDWSRVKYETFTSKELSHKFSEKDLILPFNSSFECSKLPEGCQISPSSKITWWIAKLAPGDVVPCHLDMYPDSDSETKQSFGLRYYIACSDQEMGHVFAYNNNEFLVNYKKGDMYEFSAETLWHGACNIGFTPKISIQLSVN